jgi:predicted RNase H-like HicB family nuclease
MKTAAKEVLARPYRKSLTPDESGGYLATIHEFPGCTGYGATPDEAVKKLDASALAWVDAALSTGYPIPTPVDYEGFSGKVALRLPRRIHKMAAERAELEGTSINQLLGVAIAHYLGQGDAFSKALDEVRSACSDIRAITNQYMVLIDARDIASSNGVKRLANPSESFVTWRTSIGDWHSHQEVVPSTTKVISHG